jgi:hypothetical protein
MLITHQEYEGRLSFATDAWTSPNHRAFIAITVHFQHNGMPLSTLLDVVEVPQSHTGVYLAQGFVKVLEDFGISEKARQHLLSICSIRSVTLIQILGITADNASANDTMIAEISKLIPEFGGQATRTRCFLHVINLVVKAILRKFDVLQPGEVVGAANIDPNFPGSGEGGEC